MNTTTTGMSTHAATLNSCPTKACVRSRDEATDARRG